MALTVKNCCQCNSSLTENQSALHAKLAEAAKKDDEIRDLQEQVRERAPYVRACVCLCVCVRVCVCVCVCSCAV
jgi:hypothetical protein